MSQKYSKQQYDFICSLIWGGSPVDRNWAEETSLFKTRAPEIIAEYPMLDKSFNEKIEKINKYFREKVEKEMIEISYEVFDNWKKTVVYKGTEENCAKYLLGNNVYQMNYSKLKILKNEKIKIKSNTKSEGVSIL